MKKNLLDDIEPLLSDTGLDARQMTSLKRLFWEVSKGRSGNKLHTRELLTLLESYTGEMLDAAALIHCSIDWGTKTRKKYSFLLRNQARRMESMALILGKLSHHLGLEKKGAYSC